MFIGKTYIPTVYSWKFEILYLGFSNNSEEEHAVSVTSEIGNWNVLSKDPKTLHFDQSSSWMMQKYRLQIRGDCSL